MVRGLGAYAVWVLPKIGTRRSQIPSTVFEWREEIQSRARRDSKDGRGVNRRDWVNNEGEQECKERFKGEERRMRDRDDPCGGEVSEKQVGSSAAQRPEGSGGQRRSDTAAGARGRLCPRANLARHGPAGSGWGSLSPSIPLEAVLRQRTGSKTRPLRNIGCHISP